jgi:hypothetical protein
VRAVTYDPDAKELSRAEVSWTMLRAMTAGGRMRLVDLEMFGDARDLVTLEDLERHGPGLLIDARADEFAHVAAFSALMKQTTPKSQVFVWSE